MAEVFQAADEIESGRAGRNDGCAATGHKLPCGAVHYRLDRNLRYGQMLTAEHFIAIDLLYPHAVLAALFGALDEIATECGCNAMRSILHDSRADLLEKLCVAGHRRDGMTLTKSF